METVCDLVIVNISILREFRVHHRWSTVAFTMRDVTCTFLRSGETPLLGFYKAPIAAQVPPITITNLATPHTYLSHYINKRPNFIMSGTHAKPGKENLPPQFRVHDPNEPLPGDGSGQQQFEVRYSDKNPSREVVALKAHATGPKCFQF